MRQPQNELRLWAVCPFVSEREVFASVLSLCFFLRTSAFLGLRSSTRGRRHRSTKAAIPAGSFACLHILAVKILQLQGRILRHDLFDLRWGVCLSQSSQNLLSQHRTSASVVTSFVATWTHRLSLSSFTSGAFHAGGASSIRHSEGKQSISCLCKRLTCGLSDQQKVAQPS